MFDFVRENKRLMQGVLAFLVLPSFIFFGVDKMRSGDSSTAIAVVNGEKITQQEYDDDLNKQVENIKKNFGPDFDTSQFITPEMRQTLLEQKISQRVFTQAVADYKLTVSDTALRDYIQGLPGVKKEDGSFDTEAYRNLISRINMTVPAFEAGARQDLALQQLVAATQGTAIVAKSVTERLLALNEQEREVQSIAFEAKNYANGIKVTDDMLKAYYDKNGQQFQIPEMINAEYITLSSDALAEKTQVMDAEVQAHYEQNKQNYTSGEQRKASHILLTLPPKASSDELASVKAKAQQILDQLKKSPEKFTQLAKENSQDPGSREQGGDLGFFARGAMVKPFEDTAFKLKENEISELVQSDFGFHIIQVTGIKAASVKSFEEVKVQLVEDIKKQKAKKAFVEAVEIFQNSVNENTDSLKPAADKLKLNIEKIDNVLRDPLPGAPTSIMKNNPKFLKAIFADGAIKKKQNTDAIEIAPGVMVSGRVLEYKPASKRSFDEVKDSIRSQVVHQEALALAKKTGEEKLNALKLKDDGKYSEVKLVSRLKPPVISQQGLTAILKADVQKLPAYVGVDVPGFGYEIYRINKVNAGAIDPARRANEFQQIEGQVASQDIYDFVEELKRKSKIEIRHAMSDKKDDMKMTSAVASVATSK